MPRAFIIAEAGVNHNGSMELARRLVVEARKCGADAVKFQAFKATSLAVENAPKAAYQKRQTNGESQLAMLRRLELDEARHATLLQLCREIGITFLSSPFDEASADMLIRIGVEQLKVPSGEITNLPFLRHLARTGKPILLSTGMSTLGEVEEAVLAIRQEEDVPVTLLHCVTEYPAPAGEINLRAMLTLKAAFGLPAGYSDHTEGTEIAIAAAALGACVIEKHFTLDRRLPGPDHAASLEPAEFRHLVTAIRNVEAAMGTGIKEPAPCERPNMIVARKSLVVLKHLGKGDLVTEQDVGVKRPGHGLPPKLLPLVVGRRASRELFADEVLAWEHLI